jgi:two-component system, OmpR family, response regulator MtrA
MEKRLLVVDDDVRLTGIVALNAATLGIATTQVNDPSRALDVFISVRPDVVIIDLFMPEKDGIELLNEILLTGIPTRVVLTSGGNGDLLAVAQETMRFHGLPDAEYLVKPFDRAALVGMLTRLTD